jgi:hypothetical protein
MLAPAPDGHTTPCAETKGKISSAPSLYVLPCFHIKKLLQKAYEKINKKYE